jgi:hypothetical protein
MPFQFSWFLFFFCYHILFFPFAPSSYKKHLSLFIYLSFFLFFFFYKKSCNIKTSISFLSFSLSLFLINFYCLIVDKLTFLPRFFTSFFVNIKNMTAEYCVDYLSYKWTSSDDLVQTFIETRKQCKSIIDDEPSSLSKKERKRADSENYKLLRFQNALWREMARNCTNKLSKQNRLIDPASVSW